MTSIAKVKIIRARGIPVMDKSRNTTDAYVVVK